MAQDTFNPFADSVLATYLANVRAWHSYIRFLGLPHLRENPDIVIDRLFVKPRLADRYVSPDSPPKDWPDTKAVLDVVPEHRRLVLLGDPGSGKSTLVNWLAWQLAQQAENDWTYRLGRLIPIPIVLREMHIERGITWSDLLQAFLEHEMAKPLRDTPRLEELLKHDQALIMLDGLDEIGAVEVRQDLRDAVFWGMVQYPDCRWLLTSRIVGYEDVPFDFWPAEPGPPSLLSKAISALSSSPTDVARLAAVHYVAPFTDDQIARFARNWFTLREAVGSKAEQGAQDLIEAIRRDPSTLRLARIPNLLTMMALIHRVRARLPQGRALLYNEITQAYLQSIDEFRGLMELDYPLAQKKRWLARVGFEMQRRRSMDMKKEKTDQPSAMREILAGRSEVKTWIMDAMAESGYGRNEKAAEDFVTYIGRRSGLLLPRGPEQFAFMHLSFQEYFAACFLAEQITSPQWIRHGKAAPGADREALRNYTREVIWRETLVFLFELLADQPGWPQTLVEDLFGENFKDLNPEVTEAKTAGVLLARLVVDPHSGFSQDMRDQAIAKCAELEIALQQKVDLASDDFWLYEPEVVRALFTIESEHLSWVWKALIAVAKAIDVKNLILTGCPAIKDDVAPLAKLVNLQRLNLNWTGVKDVTPLSVITNLEWLLLSRTEVSDVTHLSVLTNLQRLDLSFTAVSNVAPLSALTNLQFLFLNGTWVSNVTPLSALTNLKCLFLGRAEVSGVTSLSTLTKVLYVGDTDVSNSPYWRWMANPPHARSRLDQSPHWWLKLDRVRQFSQVAYQTGQMLRERKPCSLVYVWYGQKGQGVDLFSQRLAVELRDVWHDVYLYEVRPRWPDDLHNPHRSFEDMLLEAFEVDSLDNIPARIHTLAQGGLGHQILVYIRHQPLLQDNPIKPSVLRTYLEWWDYNCVPLLHQEIDAFGLLGISFEVRNPSKLFEVLNKNMNGLELRHTVLHVLDEMGQLTKKDLKEFLDTHRIELPRSRRERILDEILKKTDGHYEMILEALKVPLERAGDLEDKNKEENVSGEDEMY